MMIDSLAVAIGDPRNRRIMGAAMRPFGDSIPPDQREQVMISATRRCLDGFRPGRGQRFTTSLYRFTGWECRNFLRTIRRSTERLVSLSDVPEPVAPVRERQEDIDHVYECMERLSGPDRLCIEQYYLMRMTLAEIGDLNGCTREWARQTLRDAIRRLRELCLGAS